MAIMIHTGIVLNGYMDQFFIHIPKKSIVLSTSHVTTMYMLETNMPLKWHLYATYANQIRCRQIQDNHSSKDASYKFTAIKNMIRSIGIHIFHIIGMCPWTNTPATLHIYVAMHCYCCLLMKCTPQCISAKSKQLQHLFTILYPYTWATNMSFKCHIYLIYTNYLV